jgi:hypothetical protein
MNNRGQSMIETAVFFFVMAPLLGMILGFTRVMQIREKLIMAAWQGAQLYSSGAVSPVEARQKTEEFLTGGAPALPKENIHIQMGRAASLSARFFQIDQITVSYTARRPWHRFLGLPLTLEESCYVKHAPHYWDPVTAQLPIPGQPSLSGPVYPY